jgi:hypothetical protein
MLMARVAIGVITVLARLKIPQFLLCNTRSRPWPMLPTRLLAHRGWPATVGLGIVIDHGALSQQGGHVSVRWTVMDKHSAAAMLRIQWKETGGPKVAPPARQGHGSSLIRDLLNYELDGSVDLVFAPDGVSCTITVLAQSSIDTTGLRKASAEVGPAQGGPALGTLGGGETARCVGHQRYAIAPIDDRG